MKINLSYEFGQKKSNICKVSWKKTENKYKKLEELIKRRKLD